LGASQWRALVLILFWMEILSLRGMVGELKWFSPITS
jgi:hypothetical protein